MNDRAQCLVVSGFLGSGKTTLVRHLLDEGLREGVRTAVVSNEFGALGIDEALLASTAEGQGEYVELAGGCVCCRLSDDLLLTLEKLWQRSHPERVIVETSGLALPYDTLVNFWRDPVRAWSTDESSVVVVSAEQVAAGRELDGLFEDQVSAADVIVLGKLDLVDEAGRAAAEACLARLAPGVPVLRASFGQVDPRVFFPPEPGSREASRARRAGEGAGSRAGHAAEAAAHAAEAAPHAGHHAHDLYSSSELAFAPGVDEAEVVDVLSRRAALRAKGFVQTTAGLRVVQGVAGRVELSAPAKAPPPALVGRVVVIERAPRPVAALPAGRDQAAGTMPGHPREPG